MKKVFKILLWILLIIFILFLIADLLFVIKEKLNWNFSFGENKTYEKEKLENGLTTQINGDLTKEEIEKEKNDIEAPLHDDIFKDFLICETGDYVIIYRKVETNGKIIFPNLSFIKTANNLQFDGTLGLTAEIGTNWWTGAHDFNNIRFTYDYSGNFNYDKKMSWNTDWKNIFVLGIKGFLTDIGSQDNFVSFRNFTEKFCNNFWNMNVFAKIAMNKQSELNKLHDVTKKYIYQNILPYFQNLNDNIEFIMPDKNLSTDVRLSQIMSLTNSYATYLWKTVKTSNKSESFKNVNISSFFAKFIYDENIYKQYPIPENKKSEYPNQEYYKVYNCQIFASCSYKYFDIDLPGEPVVDDDYIVVLPPEDNKEYCKVTIKLKNSNSSDLTNFIIGEQPVKISIAGKDLVFDSLEKLNYGCTIALEQSKTYSYSILSNGLIFESYSGNFSIQNENSTIVNFNYTYQYGYALCKIMLHPVGEIDLSQVDLINNPVIINLKSKVNNYNYTLTFNSLDKFNNGISQLIHLGEYTYTISSQVLSFSPGNGDINVTTENRYFNFTYTQITSFNFSFNCTIDQFEKVPAETDPIKEHESVYLKVCGLDLNSQSSFSFLENVFGESLTISLIVFKNTTQIVSYGTFLLGTNLNGNCFQSLPSGFKTLENGETYTIQFIFNSEVNTGVSYSSPPIEFTYATYKISRFNITLQEI